jgi:hypothetical protein
MKSRDDLKSHRSKPASSCIRVRGIEEQDEELDSATTFQNGGIPTPNQRGYGVARLRWWCGG